MQALIRIEHNIVYFKTLLVGSIRIVYYVIFIEYQKYYREVTNINVVFH